MPKARTAYPPEFKAEAVRLYKTSGKSQSELANDLGATTNSLREQTKRGEIEEGSCDGLNSDEREELRWLKRENRILKDEREILRIAAAFFAEGTSGAHGGANCFELS